MLDVKVYSRELEAALTQMGQQLDTAPEMATAKRQIGTVALQHIRLDFVGRAKPGDPFWPPLSVVTVVLRKRGRGPKIFGETELATRRTQVQKLRDEGLLLNSLTAGGPANIFELAAFAIHVGTLRSGAEKHQDGGTTTFNFDEAKQARFKENVSPTIRGRGRPKALPEGHKYRWNYKGRVRAKFRRMEVERGQAPEGADFYWAGTWWHTRKEPSPWNSVFFRLWKYMEKISGRTRRIPKREIVSMPSEKRLARYVRLYEAGVAALVQRLGLGPAGGSGATPNGQ